MMAVALVAAYSPAADWPQWRGPSRTGISAEQISATWPTEGPKILWRASVGTGFASISVSQGRAYTMGNTNNQDTLWCFDVRARPPADVAPQLRFTAAGGEFHFDTGALRGTLRGGRKSGRWVFLRHASRMANSRRRASFE